MFYHKWICAVECRSNLYYIELICMFNTHLLFFHINAHVLEIYGIENGKCVCVGVLRTFDFSDFVIHGATAVLRVCIDFIQTNHIGHTLSRLAQAPSLHLPYFSQFNAQMDFICLACYLKASNFGICACACVCVCGVCACMSSNDIVLNSLIVIQMGSTRVEYQSENCIN